jgi:hypothetical protein
MKNTLRSKITTAGILIVTVILAGVAVFTAVRLYNLRQTSVSPASPESNPLAWDCSTYVFAVDASGKVTVNNNSSRNEALQKAKVYINDALVATFDVPALPTKQSATLGNVSVSGSFTWKVVGTVDCQNSGQVSVSPTPTPTGTPTPTPTKTPTPTPTTTLSPSPTATATPTIPTTTPGFTVQACTLLTFSLAGVTPTPTTSIGPSQTPTPTTPPESTPIPTPTYALGGPPECKATKPATPTITSVVKSGSSVTLTWTKISDVTHYTISYGTQPGKYTYGVTNTGNVTTYKISNLDTTKKYYFILYAVNDCMPSDASAEVSWTTTSTTQTTPTPTEAQLPSAGTSYPTIIGLGTGILLVALSFALAL